MSAETHFHQQHQLDYTATVIDAATQELAREIDREDSKAREQFGEWLFAEYQITERQAAPHWPMLVACFIVDHQHRNSELWCEQLARTTAAIIEGWR